MALTSFTFTQPKYLTNDESRHEACVGERVGDETKKTCVKTLPNTG